MSSTIDFSSEFDTAQEQEDKAATAREPVKAGPKASAGASSPRTYSYYTEAPSAGGLVLSSVGRKGKTARPPADGFKKHAYHVSLLAIQEINSQPVISTRAVPALIDWALAELKRQNKMLVIDNEAFEAD